MPHGPHFPFVSVRLYEPRVTFTFVNLCKNQQQKNMQQRHMWPAKLQVFTGSLLILAPGKYPFSCVIW